MVERHVSGNRLSAFLDDELDEDEALHATRHLAWCDRCVAELEALRATRDALRQLPRLQAPVLTACSSQHRMRTWQHRRRVLRRLVVTAAVPALLLGVVYVAGDTGEVEEPTELFLVEQVSRTGDGALPPPPGGDPR